MTLRAKLLTLFLAATLAPLGLTLWVASTLIQQSLALAPLNELEQSTKQLEATGKALHALDPKNTQRPLLEDLQQSIARSRDLIQAHRERNFQRAFFLTLATTATTIWLLSLLALLYLTSRITLPINHLTNALNQFASGHRLPLTPKGNDELAQAVDSFNRMADQLDRSRDKLLFLTRLETWQSVGRKMAHEVKNSLTPIRLTVEEMVARSSPQDRPFLDQASQIITEEIQTIERRVRSFNDLAAEAPVQLEATDIHRLIEERLNLLRAAHPTLQIHLHLAPQLPPAQADPDLLKGILTNLLENAADAATAIRVTTHKTNPNIEIQVEDNGPGLSPLARQNLFQPTISFKRGGMGLGLSIAKRSAVLMGGDLSLTESSNLGGAAFRLTLPQTDPNPWQNESSLSTTKKTLAVPSA
jgi:two-component system, NtrC family, nitrogen regulation sensor histidine kinase NtrY